MSSRGRRNTFVDVDGDDVAEPDDLSTTKFKQYGQFVMATIPAAGLITVYRMISTHKDEPVVASPRHVSEVEEIESVGLKKINQWKVDGLRKSKIHTGLLFALTDKLQAWHLWEHRPNSRKEGLYFKGDVVDFVVVANEVGGLRVIAGSADKNIRIWDVENYNNVRLVQSFSISKPVKKIACVGSKIVTLCGGEESKADVLMNLFGSIQVWDTQGNAIRVIGPGHGSAVSDLFVGPRRLHHSLMTWSQDGSIMLWRLDTNGKTQEVGKGLDTTANPLVRPCWSGSKITATIVYYRSQKQLHIIPYSDKPSNIVSPKASKRASLRDPLDSSSSSNVISADRVVAVALRHSNIFVAVQVDSSSSKIIRVNINRNLEYEPVQVSGVVSGLSAVVRPPPSGFEKVNKLHFLLMSVQDEKGIRIAPWPRKVLSFGVSAPGVFFS